MRRIFPLIVVLVSMSGAATAQSDSLENRLREQLRSTVTELRDLQSSQAALQAAKDKAEKERDALKAKMAKGGAQASGFRLWRS